MAGLCLALLLSDALVNEGAKDSEHPDIGSACGEAANDSEDDNGQYEIQDSSCLLSSKGRHDKC